MSITDKSGYESFTALYHVSSHHRSQTCPKAPHTAGDGVLHAFASQKRSKQRICPLRFIFVGPSTRPFTNPEVLAVFCRTWALLGEIEQRLTRVVLSHAPRKFSKRGGGAFLRARHFPEAKMQIPIPLPPTCGCFGHTNGLGRWRVGAAHRRGYCCSQTYGITIACRRL